MVTISFLSQRANPLWEMMEVSVEAEFSHIMQKLSAFVAGVQGLEWTDDDDEWFSAPIVILDRKRRLLLWALAWAECALYWILWPCSMFW